MTAKEKDIDLGEIINEVIPEDAKTAFGYIHECMRRAIKEDRKKRKQHFLHIAEKAVEEEPELPGDMPDAMWETVKNDRQAMRQAFRMTVRLTKDGILSRIKTLTENE